MSKAFTRESDDLPERPSPPRPSSAPSGKNYLTPSGARRLQDELDHLTQIKEATKPPIGETAKREHQSMIQRKVQLQESLSSAIIVPPPAQPWDQVFFGASVTVRDRSGSESQYRIVGFDETDLDRNWVSWLSPIARALLKARLGQRIQFRAPAGTQDWEIIGITYE